MSDIVEKIAQLNAPQQQAVKTDSKHVVVLAGAGSGKTRVLTHRIAWLVETGQATPHGVMAVTFTNKAAREMKSRVEELLPHQPYGMWIGTFHGIAHRLLKAHWRAVNLPENFQVLDSDDQLRLVKRIIRELAVPDDLIDAKQMQWTINGYKDEGLRAQYVPETADVHLSWQRRIYVAYEALCFRSGLVDFGELLLRAHELWLNNPTVLAHYQQQFQHVLVDEFQDTNRIQYAWLRVLCGDTVGLTVVGDDDQSIYGWRGARVENIWQIQDDYPDTEMVKLEQNYRSTAVILKAANAVISNNSKRLGKDLWTEDDGGEPIRLYAAYNEQDEAGYIADSIESQLDGGVIASDVALLYRSNAQSRVLEEALIRGQIPYRIYGGVRFYERLEVRNVLAYLRLIANRNDDAAFERVINVPARGIGAKSVELLRSTARDEGCSLWDATLLLLQKGLLKGRAGGSAHAFQELIKSLDPQASESELTLSALCKVVIETTGLAQHFEKEGADKARSRLENMQEVVNASRNYEDVAGELTPLDAFLSEASLDAGEGQAAEHEDSVHLMTLHAAKGLEFDHVFIAGLEENLFPHRMSLDVREGVDEERRLCYVGITRAKKHLCLTYAESRRLYGNDNRNRPSRFIEEIPSELIEAVRPTLSVKPTFSSMGGRLAEPMPMAMGQAGFQLGSAVRHPIFGDGIILAAAGAGANTSVTVAFENEGTKELMLQYAKLTAI
jgi:DNA helicase-2/ATP-dependent DNA helicase PcrA